MYPEIEEREIAGSIVANADINQKAMMLKGIGFHRKPSLEWYERFRTALDKIKNLQDRRNRYVHDAWQPNEQSAVTKWRKRVAIQKPQSFQSLELTVDETLPVEVKEIWALVSEIAATAEEIISCYFLHFGKDVVIELRTSTAGPVGQLKLSFPQSAKAHKSSDHPQRDE